MPKFKAGESRNQMVLLTNLRFTTINTGGMGADSPLW